MTSQPENAAGAAASSDGDATPGADGGRRACQPLLRPSLSAAALTKHRKARAAGADAPDPHACTADPCAVACGDGPSGGGYVHPFSVWRRRGMVLIFAVMAALLSADQNLLAPNMTAAAHDLGLTPDQKDTYLGGLVMAGFFLIGAPSALVCGYLGDKMNRVHLLFAIVLIGQGPCLGTYFVTAFWQFLVLRMLTGIAVGGVFPLIFSLLGDLFPASRRALMAGIVQIAIGGGIGCGQLMAGVVGPAAGWRLPFVLVAAPAIALAFVMLGTVKEPPRGAFEEALRERYAEGGSYTETISWAKVRKVAETPSNWLIIIQAIPGCMPWGVVQTYLNDYLSQDQGFTIQLATLIMFLFGVGSGAGIAGGGALGQLIYNAAPSWMPVFAGATLIAGTGPLLYLVTADLQAAGLAAALAASAAAGVLVMMGVPNMRAAVLNVNAPETRGVTLALQAVTDDLGRGLGPVVVSALIRGFGDRRPAFALALCGWVPAGLMMMCLAFTLKRDEAAMQARLAAAAAGGGGGSRRVGEVELEAGGSGGDGGGCIEAAGGGSGAILKGADREAAAPAAAAGAGSGSIEVVCHRGAAGSLL